MAVRAASELTMRAMEAFSLMNRAFAQSNKGFTSWRLFQLVFIVMEIPDILAASGRGSSDTASDVDLIYFPTGGGKTEAYLGLVVFTIFFDRLRGKKEGVSAITRFPLRLLSLQQLQRIADTSPQAERSGGTHSVIGGPVGYAAFQQQDFMLAKGHPQLRSMRRVRDSNGSER